MEPFSVAGFPGDSSQFTSFQQNQTCYGEILDPFTVPDPTWSSTDPSVATCDSTGMATAQSPGFTHIQSRWTMRFWDFDLQSGGCTRYLEQALADALCDVLDPNKITLRDVTVYERGAIFGPFNIANLSLNGSSHEADTCGSDASSPFEIRVHFVLPPGASLEHDRCTADGFDDIPEWIVVGSTTCTMESGRTGRLVFSAYRAISNDDNPKIKVVVGGNSQSGTPIDANGTISLTCTK